MNNLIQHMIHDVAFELSRMEPGDVVGMPDGSDVEVSVDHDGSGFFVRIAADSPFTITPFTDEASKSDRALSLASQAFEAEFQAG